MAAMKKIHLLKSNRSTCISLWNLLFEAYISISTFVYVHLWHSSVVLSSFLPSLFRSTSSGRRLHHGRIFHSNFHRSQWRRQSPTALHRTSGHCSYDLAHRLVPLWGCLQQSIWTMVDCFNVRKLEEIFYIKLTQVIENRKKDSTRN